MSQPQDECGEMEDEDFKTVDAMLNTTVYAAAAHNNKRTPSKSYPPLTYQIAKSPLVRNASVDDIVNQYRAQRFLPALTNYLKSIIPGFSTNTPMPINCFNIYKAISIVAGHVCGVADRTVLRI
jgi:hypothetical protein